LGCFLQGISVFDGSDTVESQHGILACLTRHYVQMPVLMPKNKKL
jgi:hypothetical protein